MLLMEGGAEEEGTPFSLTYNRNCDRHHHLRSDSSVIIFVCIWLRDGLTVEALQRRRPQWTGNFSMRRGRG